MAKGKVEGKIHSYGEPSPPSSPPASARSSISLPAPKCRQKNYLSNLGRLNRGGCSLLLVMHSDKKCPGMSPPAYLPDALPHSFNLQGPGLALDEDVTPRLSFPAVTPLASVRWDLVHPIGQVCPSCDVPRGKLAISACQPFSFFPGACLPWADGAEKKRQCQ